MFYHTSGKLLIAGAQGAVALQGCVCWMGLAHPWINKHQCVRTYKKHTGVSMTQCSFILVPRNYYIAVKSTFTTN